MSEISKINMIFGSSPNKVLYCEFLIQFEYRVCYPQCSRIGFLSFDSHFGCGIVARDTLAREHSHFPEYRRD